MNATQESPELRLRDEHAADRWGDPYIEEWYCDVPAEGVAFTVVRQEWTEDYTVRKILEVRLG